MGAFKSAVITAKGQALLAKAVLNTADLEFTKIAVSENKLTGDLVSKTGIGTIKQDAKVASVKRTNNSSVKVSASIANNDLTSGYYVRNIGLYAKDPDEGEILYSISVADEGSATADWMPPYNGVGVSSLMIDLVTVVGNSDNVKVEVDPTAFATVAQIVEVNEHLTALDNTITTTTEKTLKGSVAGGLKINSVGGMTRKCANLIPFPYVEGSQTAKGLTISVNNGIITINGTATGDGSFCIANTLINCTGQFTLSGVADGSMATYYLVPIVDGATANIVATAPNTYTVKSAVNRIDLYYRAGTVFNNTVIRPMLNAGTTALPYEPYFEGLRSVEINKVITHGKNFFNVSSANLTQNSTTITGKVNTDTGVKFTVDVSFGSTAHGVYTNSTIPELTIGKPYTISCEVKVSALGNFTYFALTNGLGKVQKFNANEFVANTFVRCSMPFEAKSSKFTFYFNCIEYKDGADFDVEIKNIQIEGGTVATEFEPYKENSITLSQPIILNGIPVSSGGNTIDENGQRWLCDKYDWEKDQIIKRCGVVDLGTLNWNKLNAYNNGFYAPHSIPNLKIGTINILTTLYKYGYGVDKHMWVNPSENVLYVLDSDYTDAETFKSAMSGVMLYYELAEPIITDISDILPIEDQISFRSLLAHGGITYLLTDSKENPVIEVEYGTNKTGAHTLTGLLTAQRNELKLAELTTAVLALNQE